MAHDFISQQLQSDIIRALLIFYPYAPTGKQYFNCFGDRDASGMLMSIISLKEKGYIPPEAVAETRENSTLLLCHLRLTPKGFSHALTCLKMPDRETTGGDL